MSFLIKWDADKIISDLSTAAAEACSSYNDGFSAWQCKKDMLKVKYALDEMLERTPNFSHLEEEFVQAQEKQKVWKTLETK